MSQTVKDLVVGSGIAFEDAGEQELKVVPDAGVYSALLHEQRARDSNSDEVSRLPDLVSGAASSVRDP